MTSGLLFALLFSLDAGFFERTSISFFLSKLCKPRDISLVVLHSFWIEIHIHCLVFFRSAIQQNLSKIFVIQPEILWFSWKLR